MFTGLIEAMGTICGVHKTGSVFRLSIECPWLAQELVYGQSVAVNGVCLSVVALRGNIFDIEMMPETASRTRFASLARGTRVNLERAMKMGGRLDGHLVLGHVDGTATVTSLSGSSQTRKAWFETTKELMRTIVSKGSVAIDGISLTVIDADEKIFSVGLIPATLEGCTLGQLQTGDIVNVETDIVGKYVERLLGQRASGKLTLEELGNLGY